MISIRYGWLDTYIVLFNDSRSNTSSVRRELRKTDARFFVSRCTHDSRQTSWNFYDCSSTEDIRSKSTWDRGLKYLQQVAWQLNT